MQRLLQLVAVVLCLCRVVAAQDVNPITQGSKQFFDRAKGYLLPAVQKVPETEYAFRAAPEERSFARLVGHLADANYFLCSTAAGEKTPAGGFENRKATKAELLKAVTDVFSYCDKVFSSMTDAEGARTVQFTTPIRPESMPKLSVLEYNNVHNFEHYGNLTVYMRLRGVVPPSSETPEIVTSTDRPTVKLSATAMNAVVGMYELQPGNTLIITRQGDQLFGQVPTRGPITLFAASDTLFFAKIVDAEVEFVKASDGKIQSAILRLSGREQKFQRQR